MTPCPDLLNKIASLTEIWELNAAWNRNKEQQVILFRDWPTPAYDSMTGSLEGSNCRRAIEWFEVPESLVMTCQVLKAIVCHTFGGICDPGDAATLVHQIMIVSQTTTLSHVPFEKKICDFIHGFSHLGPSDVITSSLVMRYSRIAESKIRAIDALI